MKFYKSKCYLSLIVLTLVTKKYSGIIFKINTVINSNTSFESIAFPEESDVTISL